MRRTILLTIALCFVCAPDDEEIAHKSPAALTVCNASDRAALLQLAASIDTYNAWGSPGFDKGEVITIRGAGFTSPAGIEVRWLSAVPNVSGTVDTYSAYAPASLNPHFPDIEISAVVPDNADGIYVGAPRSSDAATLAGVLYFVRMSPL